MTRFFPNFTPAQEDRLLKLGINLDESYVRLLKQISPEWTLRNLNTLHMQKPDPEEPLIVKEPEEWVALLDERPSPIEIPLAVVVP